LGKLSRLKIYRRKRDNTYGDPSNVDNSNAMLTYTINSAITDAMAVGDSLWVRLNDELGGTLVQGDVSVLSDDQTNIYTNNNVWQILSASETPTRSFDNLDVFMLAKRVTINTQASLIFSDGSVLSDFGQMLNTNLDITG
jgi:type II secretory pathway component HofQ